MIKAHRIANHILEDLGLYIGPFSVTLAKISEAQDQFSITDLENLLELAFADRDDKTIGEARKMALRRRSQVSQKHHGGKSGNIYAAMIRALARKGVLVHGNYKPSGDATLITAWRKFTGRDKGGRPHNWDNTKKKRGGRGRQTKKP